MYMLITRHLFHSASLWEKTLFGLSWITWCSHTVWPLCQIVLNTWCWYCEFVPNLLAQPANLSCFPQACDFSLLCTSAYTWATHRPNRDAEGGQRNLWMHSCRSILFFFSTNAHLFIQAMVAGSTASSKRHGEHFCCWSCFDSSWYPDCMSCTWSSMPIA